MAADGKSRWIERGYDSADRVLWEHDFEEAVAAARLFNWLIMAGYTVVRTSRNLVELRRLDPGATCQRLVLARRSPFVFEHDITERVWPA